MTAHRGGRGTPGGNVAASEWSSPPVSAQVRAVAPGEGAPRARAAGSRTAGSRAAERTSIATSARVGDVPEVGEQTVAHVDHGGGAQRGGFRPGVVGRSGPEMRPDQLGPARRAGRRRRISRRRRCGQPASSRARPAAEWPSGPATATTSSGPGAGARHRVAALQVTEAGDGEEHCVEAGHVAAGHRGARAGATRPRDLRPRRGPRTRAGPGARRRRRGARSRRRPWPRRRPGCAPRPGARCPPDRTSPGGNAVPPAGSPWSRRPGRRARRAPRHRRRSRSPCRVRAASAPPSRR